MFIVLVAGGDGPLLHCKARPQYWSTQVPFGSGGGQYSIYISKMILVTKMSYIGLSSEVVDIYVRFSNSADAGVM